MRIGVNIPDKLLQQVREIRPEVNVSQICRQALEDRAALAERVKAQVEETGMGTRIQRFLEPDHAPLPEPDWVGHAMDDARSWVESVDPSEWHSLNGFYDRSADKENCIVLIFEIRMASAGGGGITRTGARSVTCEGTMAPSTRLSPGIGMPGWPTTMTSAVVRSN